MFRGLAMLLLSCAALAAARPVAAAEQTPAPAAAPGPAAAPAKDPRAALLKLLPAGSKLDDLKASPIPGIYEYSEGADVSYLTADGKYFIDGNIYDMATRENLTESRRSRMRAALIDAVPESQMVIFSPKDPKYTITVFTDVDCPYCRKLHAEIAEINQLGIRVRYLFYPRTGPNTESWRKAEAVWCAPDRSEALTRATAGAKVDTGKLCSPTPVAREYALGQSIGVRGTPAILTENGEYISGYMPAQDLLKAVKDAQPARR